jgi:hypothetical protein
MARALSVDLRRRVVGAIACFRALPALTTAHEELASYIHACGGQGASTVAPFMHPRGNS